MKSKNILDLLKQKNIVIPSLLFRNYKELKIDEKEVIFLSYLMMYEGFIAFDVVKFASDLNYSTDEVMLLVSSLCEKCLINMVVKQEDKVMKEFLDISFLYNRLVAFVLKDEEEEVDDSLIYERIEKEFGRTLSPIEYETIKQWIDSGISDELILEALKEAVLNGVNNLKYIDKILYEWCKKGYKRAVDVRRKAKKQEEVIDLFSYDWLDEND